MVALTAQQADTVQWLLDNGVDIDRKMKQGYSVRNVVAAKPYLFSGEIQKIILNKVLEVGQETVKKLSSVSAPQKKSLWQRLLSRHTKE